MAKKKIERKHVSTTIDIAEYDHICHIAERDYTNVHSWLRRTVEAALEEDSKRHIRHTNDNEVNA